VIEGLNRWVWRLTGRPVRRTAAGEAACFYLYTGVLGVPLRLRWRIAYADDRRLSRDEVLALAVLGEEMPVVNLGTGPRGGIVLARRLGDAPTAARTVAMQFVIPGAGFPRETPQEAGRRFRGVAAEAAAVEREVA
jgi:hypothetical protein